MLEHNGPVYLRCGRIEVPEIYDENASFQIGKANQLRDGKDVTIIANGLMVGMALDAAALLAKDRVTARVLDMHTVKPLDEAAIVAAAKETNRIVVAEEHLMAGGRMQLGTNMEPGEYVFQVIVTDKLAKEKYNAATQWLDFEIVK